MSTLIPIPSPPSPHHSLQVELDGVTYTLDIRWNERDLAWYVELQDAEEQRLVAPRKVVLGFPLFARFYTNPLVPKGQFMAVDTSNTDQEPTLADLGSRVQLVYVTAAEIAEIAGQA